MKKLNTPETELIDRRQHYIKVTRNVRWAALALIVATYPMQLIPRPLFLGLAALGVFYNLLWHWPKFYQHRWLGRVWTMNLIDNVLVLILVVISGGIVSPYYALFIPTVTAVALWYGPKSFRAVIPFHLLAGGLFWLFHSQLAVDISPIRRAIVLVFVILADGYLAQCITWANRLKRRTVEQAKQTVETEKQRLLTLIHSMGEGVIATDPSGEVVLYNGAALDLLNTNVDLKGYQLKEVMPVEKAATGQEKDQEDENINLIKEAEKQHGIMRRQDLVLPVDNNEKINLDITLSPIVAPHASSGAEGGYILIARDITKEKNLEEARDEFISVTSHELRTPVAITEANLSTALLPDYVPDNPKTVDLLEQAHQNTVFLANLISDLSTLSRAESGLLDVDLSEVEPAELLEQLSSDYRQQAEEQGLKMATETSGDISSFLSSPAHIKEVLQNFITNAIKYSNEGTITLKAYNPEGNDGVVFAVEDEGVGIAKSDQKHVFEKFYRAEDFHTRETGGTGLGLYVASKLAEKLGGAIWMESQKGEGSTFYLWTPPLQTEQDE